MMRLCLYCTETDFYKALLICGLFSDHTKNKVQHVNLGKSAISRCELDHNIFGHLSHSLHFSAHTRTHGWADCLCHASNVFNDVRNQELSCLIDSQPKILSNLRLCFQSFIPQTIIYAYA